VDVTNRTLSTLAPGSHVDSSVPLPNGRILITNEDQNTVALADGKSGAIERTISAGNGPDAAVWDPATGRAFVMNHASGDVSVIDADEGVEVKRVPVGGELEAAAVDGAGKLFVNVENRDEIAVLDTRTLSPLTRYKLPDCDEPSGLAYISTVDRLVAVCANGHAKVVRASDGHETNDFLIGPHPDAVLFDSKTSRVYIPTAGSLLANGEITVLNIAADGHITLAGHIPTQRGARTIAQDPDTGLLYLPTADYVIGPGEKPKVVEGTFRVLVVEPTIEPSK
jgi:DNA-binding beta-propeller fold protein YncE